MRVGHRISSPKGAAKKEVHTNRPQVAGKSTPHSQPRGLAPPTSKFSGWGNGYPTQGQQLLPLVPERLGSTANDVVSLDTTFRLSTQKPHTCFFVFSLSSSLPPQLFNCNTAPPVLDDLLAAELHANIMEAKGRVAI